MAPKIDRVEAVPFFVPFRQDFGVWSIAGRTTDPAGSGYVIVRVTSSDGVVGYGEAGRFFDGETPASIVWAVENVFAPHLVGADPLNLGPLLGGLNRCLRENKYAKSAIDIALFDLAGKTLGVPACYLLGGKYREDFEVAARISAAADIAQVAERGQRAVAEGYTCIKVKVGQDIHRDLNALRALRSAVGDAVSIRIDANCGYRLDVVPELRKMAELGVLVLEQPVPLDDMDGLKRFTDAAQVTIMADEAATGPQAVYQIARNRAAHAIQIKLGRAAGMAGAGRMATTALSAGLMVGIGSMLELGVGSAAVLHVAAAVPELGFPLETTGAWTFAESDILRERLAPTAGRFRLPSGNGLGVDVDEDILSEYHARDRWS